MEGILSMYQFPLDFVEAMNQHRRIVYVTSKQATETFCITDSVGYLQPLDCTTGLNWWTVLVDTLKTTFNMLLNKSNLPVRLYEHSAAYSNSLHGLRAIQ